MRHELRWVLVALLVLAAVNNGLAQGGSDNRYALIVGNNFGRTEAVSLENLRHAEREATRLRDALVRFGNFQPQRVALVVGQGRQAILDAARRLADLHRADRKQLGEVPSLFALFFSGHGLAGRLLTADEPLHGAELAEIYREMDATLSLGFFDACYAGSLDLASLLSKGVIRTPGFSPIRELPEELLNAEGTMWFTSSRPDELSYEDEKLGGLFTHFFIESFTEAASDGVGVSLENMWEYARRKTLGYANRFGRTQTPEKVVRNLKARGPLYFSFTKGRQARLVFDSDIAGTFLLRYEDGSLVEKITKPGGQALEVPVYEGALVLSRLADGPEARPPSREFQVRNGDEVHIRAMGSELSSRRPGYGEVPIHSKGDLPGIELSQLAPRSTWNVGGGVRFAAIDESLLGVPWSARATVEWTWGPWTAGLEGLFGTRSSRFETWSYRLRESGAALQLGYGHSLLGLRVDYLTRAGVLFWDLEYQDGERRLPTGLAVEAVMRLGVPIPYRAPWVYLRVEGFLGALASQGAATRNRSASWTFLPGLAVSLVIPVSGR